MFKQNIYINKTRNKDECVNILVITWVGRVVNEIIERPSSKYHHRK